MIFNESILLYLIILCQIILIARQMYLIGEFKKNVRRPLMFRSKYLFSKRVKGEDMALVYNFSCDAPVDGDVVERRVTVTVNGENVSTDPYAPDTVDFGEFTFAQDDSVVVSLVDVDDAGNVSDPAVLEFVATDTLPPVVPGGFSVALVREVPDTPEPAPPPPVEGE